MMTTLIIGFALGMRHGTDPDHLTAIDGLSRIRPRATNGLLFAVGHGLVVTMLAVGAGKLLADRVAFIGPWLLILIGFINLAKLLQKSPSGVVGEKSTRPIVVQPFLLGMLLAAGFESASQLSALFLAGAMNPWLLGSVFTLGMVLVDGFDGYLAASTQYLAAAGAAAARNASRLLGILVVVFSFGIGGAELLGFDLTSVALPLGLVLFVVVVTIRVRARSGRSPLAPGRILARSQSTVGAL
jgi:nickel/cobalt transporter (NiCoT) family protein